MHLTNPPAPKRATHPARWPPRGPVRVLIVLDQPLVVALVKLTLQHGVYDTRSATSGAQALATLATWRPHLVLVGMDLEGGSIVNERSMLPPRRLVHTNP